jgi:sugar/nucleoside kinase (ribokinase family)
MPSALVIGDVMTDIVVRADGPIAFGADRRAAIRLLPGGSGANQAAWLAAEGIDTVFAGRVGRADREHQAALLQRHGVQAALAADDALPTGTLVTLVSADGERSFLTDRAANENFSRADLPDALFDAADWIHVSGYAFFAEKSRAAVIDVLSEARRRGIPYSVDPASWSFLEEVTSKEFLRWTAGAALILANEDEARVLASSDDPDRQLALLMEHYPLVALKRGAGGAIAANAEGERWSAPAKAVEAVDTSGAGDAFLGGFLAARLRGEGVEAALRRGVELGRRAVTFLGARPPVA